MTSEDESELLNTVREIKQQLEAIRSRLGGLASDIQAIKNALKK